MRAIIIGVIGIIVSVSGCWADFPDSRFEQDAAVQPDSGPGVDWSVDGLFPTDGPVPTDLPAGDVHPNPDAFSCTPDTFVSCVDERTVEWCNEIGDGTAQILCIPSMCSANLGRCEGCDPASPPECQESTLIFCAGYGLTEQTECPAGCDQGACCPDVDQDTYSSCTGDCDDQNPLVNPGQTIFQTIPGSEGFDFDCDGVEEKEYPNLVNCTLSGGTCEGSGWQGSVPECGDSGTLVICTKKANDCQTNEQPYTQGCL